MTGRASVWRDVLRTPIPYVIALVLAFVVPAYIAYLWPDIPPIKGQSIQLVLLWIGCLVAGALWMGCRWAPSQDRLLKAFLLTMAGAWIVSMAIARFHGDAFNYGAWLYVPILLMLLFKTPSSDQAWLGLAVLGWGVSIILALTRVLEIAGVIEIFQTPSWVTSFEARSYWLPLSDFLGLNGRWPGPYRGAVDTAMMGALLVVLALAHWRRSSWVFLTVGGVVMLLTGSRAALVGVFVATGALLLFSHRGRLDRIPTWTRWTILAGTGIAFGAALIVVGPGLTGRNNIWPQFIALWQTSPVVGAGTSSFAGYSPLTAISGHAHNIVLDVLVRYGIIGALVQFAAIGVGLFVLGRAAGRGAPGPAALVLFYLVVSLTDVRNDWLHPSLNLVIICLAVVIASTAPPAESASPAPTHQSEPAVSPSS